MNGKKCKIKNSAFTVNHQKLFSSISKYHNLSPIDLMSKRQMYYLIFQFGAMDPI